MARSPRIDFPGARHHIMNRGARNAAILESDAAKQTFLKVLAELPARFSVRVHAYVLMPNHYHLMVSSPLGNLSRAMRHLGAGFTQRLNADQAWDGPVFRGRYKNQVVGDNRYWMHLLAYLHLNPVPSLVARPEDWPWSSHRAYIGAEDTPAWLSTQELIEAFGSRRALLDYVVETLEGRGTAPEGWDPLALWKLPVSDVVTSASPIPERSWRAAQQAIAEVVGVTGQTKDELLTSRRGRRDNRARWLTAWWLERRSGLTQREIGRHMDCGAASIGNIFLRLRRQAQAGTLDPELAAWMQALDELARRGG